MMYMLLSQIFYGFNRLRKNRVSAHMFLSLIRHLDYKYS
jgi:hypothetical protein